MSVKSTAALSPSRTSKSSSVPYLRDDETWGGAVKSRGVHTPSHRREPSPSVDKPSLLLIEDDREVREHLRSLLSADYALVVATDRRTGVAMFSSHRPAVVILNLGLPSAVGTPDEGFAALGEILAVEHRTKVVITSREAEREIALKAVGLGAYTLLPKPIIPEELKLLLKRCFHVAQLEREFAALQKSAGEAAGLAGMVGTSPAMQTVFGAIRKVAASNAPVMILGESGTGKEMVARAIHDLSPRKKGPFIAINCSAIPESLLESELFGHEKGAFTGATGQRKGRIEQAEEGTLFLDEIGEVSLSVQVKLLRYLQEQTIERVGGQGEIRVNARVLAATNADLLKGIKEGTFREDFFYRLAVVKIPLPSLRERAGDLRLVAEAFLRRYSEQNARKNMAFGQDALKAMEEHTWPGNIRELQNRVRRAVIMAESSRISAADLELAATPTVAPTTLKEARDELEREMVTAALRRNGGKISPAAVELGISRPTLYELMDRFAIPRGDESST